MRTRHKLPLHPEKLEKFGCTSVTNFSITSAICNTNLKIRWLKFIEPRLQATCSTVAIAFISWTSHSRHYPKWSTWCCPRTKQYVLKLTVTIHEAPYHIPSSEIRSTYRTLRFQHIYTHQLRFNSAAIKRSIYINSAFLVMNRILHYDSTIPTAERL